ncbi:MAG: heavy metal sensor histidine kinase [Paenalcaligenes sp.]
MRAKRNISLRLRLAILFSLISAVLFALMGAYVYNSLESEVSQRDDLSLVGRVDRIKAIINDNQNIAALKSQPEMYDNMMGNKENLLWIVSAEGTVLIEVNPAGFSMPALSELKSSMLFTIEAAEPARMAWATVGEGDNVVFIVAAKVLKERNSMMAVYSHNLMIAWLVGVLLTFVVGWEAARRGLKPLLYLSKQAADIGPHDLKLRLDEHSQPQELQAVTAALNSMLARLEEGYSRLSQFSEDLAHEMRTPLNTLMIQNQLALSRPPTLEGYEQLLESLQEEYERLSRMIDNMLFLARAEKQDTVLHYEQVDLHTLAQQLSDYFEGMAQERGMRIAVQATGALQADLRLLRRCLANLLANAIRYGEPNSIITLRSHACDTGTDVVVSNHGSQIDSHHLPKLFDRFYRCDASRSRPDDSGGLGLAIVKSIMQMHGGEVLVSSTQTETEFTLHFPTYTE